MVRRVLLDADPFRDADAGRDWSKRGVWPARWIAPPRADPPFVAAFRLRVEAASREIARIHVTADERYELFLDGERVARGSERGDRETWWFETWDVELAPGPHVLVSRVWALGNVAPFAQMTVRPGFLLAAEGAWADRLSTGRAAWDTKLLSGYRFVSPGDAWGTGANLDLDGAAYPWGVERGEGDGWTPAAPLHDGMAAGVRNDAPYGHFLAPGTLPPMLETVRRGGRVRLVAAPPSAETGNVPVRGADHLTAEAPAWEAMLRGGGAVAVAPGTRRRVLVDLEDYVCAYPDLVVSGGRGGFVRVQWEEGLYEGEVRPGEWVRHRPKGNRSEVEGKYFVGVGDVFRPDGGRSRAFSTLWWQAGRYVEILAEAAAEPLVIESFSLRETRYPLEPESRFACDDPALEAAMPVMLRALQMCAHETYMDCPYYEQLMYVGDTRLESLVTLVLTRDDRLPRKALRTFDGSRLPSGLTQSRYPSRVRQVIPPFSLWWVAMVRDYALWRGDEAFIRSLLPGVRAVLDHFSSRIGARGLIEAPEGWNYVDWVPAWPGGMPPGADRGVSAALNWQFALVCARTADVEEWVGEPEEAARRRRIAADVARAAEDAFWDDARGLLADDLERTSFSEHVQCLALLSGLLDPERARRAAEGLFAAPDLHRTTIYFSHYLFETCRLLGRPDALFRRLDQWRELPGLGFKTTLEHPEPSRSDCHGWGAHPLFHCYATILGIRPSAPGGRTFTISPMLGPLRRVSGILALPAGDLSVEVDRTGDRPRGRVVVPPGIAATWVSGGRARPLATGAQDVAVD